MATDREPQEVLRTRFGLENFRSGQEAVIHRLIAGKNVAAVFPTGGGKSLCYQLPSQIFSGTTVIVSPLIALMKDQCDALASRGIQAARLDSSLSATEFQSSMRGIRDGSIKMLYVSPERFFNERFLASVGSLKVSLFAIDEAHCISQWGHNFRPDYLKLARLSQELSAERILALTATATPDVLEDIREAFGIDSEDAIRTPFFRPNLQLRSTIVDDTNQYETLLNRLRSRQTSSTLVYVTTQKTAERVAERLQSDGFQAVAYHAGLDDQLRAEIQQQFIDSDDQVVVATIAFGMGIDKANIRYVYHYNPPKSLESYAQEIGRAGRDGEDSVCEMLLNPVDRTVLENFTFGDTPSAASVQMMMEFLVGQPNAFHVSHYKLSSLTDIRILVIRTLITYLEIDGRLRTTSPRYDSYKIKPLVTSKSILSHFKGEPRQFAAGVLSQLTKGRTWFTLNTVLAAKKLDSDRSRVVKAIEYMSERGWLEVKVSDLVHGYQWMTRPSDPAEVQAIAVDLHQRLVDRESAEVSRLDGVFELARASDCQSGKLSAHFGEQLDAVCGRCSSCLGQGPFSIPSITADRIGTGAMAAIEKLAKEHEELLATTRSRAKFLCGLSSPGFIRAKLTRHPNYGICERVPFAKVLEQIEDSMS